MSTDEMTGTRGRRRTLGKGLGALLGEAAEDYARLEVRPDGSAGHSHPAGPEKAAASGAAGTTGAAAPGGNSRNLLAVDLLQPGPFQPRRDFDAAALADLAQSIREQGIIQPLVVRPDPVRSGHYQIIAGERRWRAAQQAGLHEVPAVVRAYTDTQALEVALIENVQRQDLNPIEEAEGYSRLHSEFGHTQEQIARLVGKSRAHVANTLRLLTLPDPVQQALRKGGLTAGHARALLTAIRNPDFLERLVNQGFEGSVREAEELAREAREKQGVPAGATGRKPRWRDPNIVQLEKTVGDTLGLSVSIVSQGTRGALTIRYQNLEQLDDVLHRLCGKAVRIG